MKFYYYVDKEGVRQGPLPLEDLTTEEISLTTLVWTKGMEKWMKAKDVADFSDLFSTLDKSEIASDTQQCNSEVQTSNDKDCLESDVTAVDVSGDNNSNHRVCTNCGCLVSGDAQFCTECGHEIGKATNTQFINDVIDDEHKSKKKTWIIIAVVLIVAFSLLFSFFLSSRQSTNNIGNSALDVDSALADTVSNLQEVEISTVTYRFKNITKEVIMKTIEPDENGEYQYYSKSLDINWPLADVNNDKDDGLEALSKCLIHFLFDDKDDGYVANGPVSEEIKRYLSTPNYDSDYTEYEIVNSIPSDISPYNQDYKERKLKVAMQSRQYISYCLETFENGGGSVHGYEKTWYLNYNKRTNTVMSLYDVFKDPNGGRLLSIINYLLKKKYIDDYDSCNPKAVEVPQQTWHIGKNGILVHFNTYEIASYACGTFDIEIPYNGNEELFTETFLKSMAE